MPERGFGLRASAGFRLQASGLGLQEPPSQPFATAVRQSPRAMISPTMWFKSAPPSATSSSSSCSACSASATTPTARRSARRSTRARAATSRSTPSTPRSIGSRARGCCDRGKGRRRRSAAAAGASSTRCSRPGIAALRQAYHAFRSMADGLEGTGWSRSEPDGHLRRVAMRLLRAAAAARLARLRRRRPRRRVPACAPPRPRRRRAAGSGARPSAVPVRAAGVAAHPAHVVNAPRHSRRPIHAHRAVRRPPRAARLRGAPRRSRSPSSPCWRSASAPTPPSSASSTPCLLRPLPFEEPERLVRLFHMPPQATFPGMATLLAVARELLRLAARRAVVRGDGRLPLPPVHADRRRQRRSGARGSGRGRTSSRSCARSPRSGARSSRRRMRRRGRTSSSSATASGRGISARRRDAVGRTLTFDGETYTIVGVMPAAFSVAAWGATAQPMWVPLAWTDDGARRPREPQLPGDRAAEARRRRSRRRRSELEVISKRLERGVSRGQRRLGRHRDPAAGGDRRRHPARRW